MSQPIVPPSPAVRPGCGQWLALGGLAAWLAVVPVLVTPVVLYLGATPSPTNVQLGLTSPTNPILPAWAAGALGTLLGLGLHLAVLLPVWLAGRRRGSSFVGTWAGLGAVVAIYLALVALAQLPWPADAEDPFGPGCTRTAALQLGLTLSFLLLVGGSIEVRRHGGSLAAAWRALGLRLRPSGLVLPALCVALVASAITLWPWVVAGSLGSVGTTAMNAFQSLPRALGEELLFRGMALIWLWRAAGGESRPASADSGGGIVSGPAGSLAAAGSLLLFVAAQGGALLPTGDWSGLGRFVAALCLGLLFTELAVRAGGSIWPAVVAHFLYDWFHLAFVDPRTQAEILHWLALRWAVIVSGGLGLLLWLVRMGRQALRSPSAAPPGRAGRLVGRVVAVAVVVLAWGGVASLYLGLGAPGFHPDGFIITLDEQADLSPAAAIADPAERRAWVYATLVETAKRSQAPLRAELDRRNLPYRPHYLVNAIEVLARPDLRRTFARLPGVGSVLFQPGVRPYAYSRPFPGSSGWPNGVPWNVSQVGADQVWAAGYTGQGIVVGSADTGVDWDHPALKAAYLGWTGTGVDHNYHWYDPWDGRPTPFDDSGHGTHTTGTMVGQEEITTLGVAPGARWIACRNMRSGIGNPGSYVACMEFLLAPFPLGGDPLRDGDPARGAHVVNNSWGCPKREGCLPDTLLLAVDHLRAAGQMMVVSAGNEGPACSTVQDPPAIYDSVFSVGAIERSEDPATFTSRGPVTVDGSVRRKPDIVAPGVDILSSVPDGYELSSGTSMAGPHVAGAVALLWSAAPELIGDLDRTEALLITTAEPLAVSAEACTVGGDESHSNACPCGGESSGAVPNNVFGWGQVDIWAAVQAALAGP